MRCVISAEVGDERRDFALELHIERFEDVQAVGTRLTAHNPVDVGVVVHANAERLHRVDIRVRATVERAVKRRELVVGVDSVKILLRFLDDAVVAERVEVDQEPLVVCGISESTIMLWLKLWCPKYERMPPLAGKVSSFSLL